MNARQAKKYLKMQIKRLKSDNDLMRRIIVESPKMQELYNLYTKPLNCTVTTMQFKEYRSKRFLPPDNSTDIGIITLFKREITNDLLDELKNHITYNLDAEGVNPTITANIFVGIK